MHRKYVRPGQCIAVNLNVHLLAAELLKGDERVSER